MHRPENLEVDEVEVTFDPSRFDVDAIHRFLVRA